MLSKIKLVKLIEGKVLIEVKEYKKSCQPESLKFRLTTQIIYNTKGSCLFYKYHFFCFRIVSGNQFIEIDPA